MAKDGTVRGGPRPKSGRKSKAVIEKMANRNPGGRKLKVIDLSGNETDLDGVEMPPVDDYLKAEQKDGSAICAEAIYTRTWEWLHKRNCDELVSQQLIQQYAMSVARWIQCEEAVSKYGFLAKRANGSVISSPYVVMSREYMKQSNNLWYQIYQVVKENCTVEIGGPSPQDNVIERLRRARDGRQ